MNDIKNKRQPELESILNRQSILIARRIKRRNDDPNNPSFKIPTNSAGGILRIQAYQLVNRLKRCGYPFSFEDSASRARRGSATDGWTEVLSAISSRLGEIEKSDRNRIRLMARELDYASKRGVPAKYLIGFLHQEGGSKRIQRLRSEELAEAGGRSAAAPPPKSLGVIAQKAPSKTKRLKTRSLPRKRFISARRRGRGHKVR